MQDAIVFQVMQEASRHARRGGCHDDPGARDPDWRIGPNPI